jgi:plastocyanin
MSNTTTRTFLHPGVLGASLAALVLALAACSSSSPAESTAGGVESEGAAAACEVSAGATAAATNTIASSTFGDEVTISAGESVTFTNDDGVGHTITQGSGGQAASDACVNQSIAGGASVTVTFNDPGDYDITCTIHTSMQTVVHVQ